MTNVSRDVLRAVLEVRDLRHGEAHAALLALYEGLVAELVAQGVIDSGRLAARIAAVQDAVSDGVHGESGRSIMAHAVTRLSDPQAAHWRPHGPALEVEPA